MTTTPGPSKTPRSEVMVTSMPSDPGLVAEVGTGRGLDGADHAERRVGALGLCAASFWPQAWSTIWPMRPLAPSTMSGDDRSGGKALTGVAPGSGGTGTDCVTPILTWSRPR